MFRVLDFDVSFFEGSTSLSANNEYNLNLNFDEFSINLAGRITQDSNGGFFNSASLDCQNNDSADSQQRVIARFDGQLSCVI